jgi:AcrR family transcriptional regulator
MGEPDLVEQTYAEMLGAYRVRRRELLLLAAADVLNERGIRHVTMDDVAQRAGVSKVILYRYFGSKDKLVHAVLNEVVEAILTADLAEADWWTDRVRRTLRVARQHPSAMRLLVRHASHDAEFGVHFDRLTAALVARVEERQQAILGPVDQSRGAFAVLAESVTAFLLDAYVRWIEHPDDTDDERFLDWVTKSVRAMVFYWRGLEP